MDELLIPVFILFSLLVPVIALALLFYAVPVRAAITLLWRGDRKEQAVVISWGIVGIRSSGNGTGRKTELLIADHAVLSHTGPRDTRGKKIAPAQTPGPAGALKIDEIVPIVQKIIGPVGSFGSAFWNESRFEDARGTVTLGLGDPALTGEICGYYWASRFILQASRVYIGLEPVFDRLVFGLDITVRVKVRHPLLVMIAGLELARDPAVKDAVHMVMGRKRGVAGA
jgi:hypothetical protein